MQEEGPKDRAGRFYIERTEKNERAEKNERTEKNERAEEKEETAGQPPGTAGSKAVRRTEKKGTGKRSFQRKEPGSDESGADGGASGFRERGGFAAAGG